MLRFLPLVLVSIACVSSGPPDDTATIQPMQDAGAVQVGLRSQDGAGTAESLQQIAIDPDSLHPIVQATGPMHAVPTAITISFARDVITEKQRKAGDAPETKLTISPNTPGTMRWLSRRQLEFVPDEPLRHETTYRVALETIDTKSGPLTLTNPVKAEFTTPEFALHHAELARTKPNSPEQTFLAVFTGPVEKDQVDALVLRDQTKNIVTLRPFGQPKPHILQFVATAPALRNPGTVTLQVRGTVRGTGGDATTGERSLVMLPESSDGWTLENLRVREGANAFMLDIVCDDDSAPGWSRYYWDREVQDSYWISSRCELSEEGLDAVHIEPPVDVEIVPSGGGFRLRGDFQRGFYNVRIEAGAETRDGGRLQRPITQRVFVPTRKPTLDLTDEGRYLTRSAWDQLPVRHRNVPQAQLTLRHIPKRNLMFWLSDTSEAATARNSELVANVTVPLRAPLDASVMSWLSLSDIEPDPSHGVYEVEIKAGQVKDVSRILVTDLELVAKAGRVVDGTWSYDVWVKGVHDHTPRADAALKLLRPSGQVVASCRTNKEGMCRLQTNSDDVDDTAPIAIIAESGTDLTYLRFQDVQVPLAEQAVAGVPWSEEVPYRASIYTDRGVYRPGETTHVSALLRDAKYAAPSAGMPVQLHLRGPRGKVLRKLYTTTNAAGFVSFDIEFSDYATTGTHEVVLHVADKPVSSTSFGVEEFVPERMEVQATIPSQAVSIDDEILVETSARYLFGGSAEGSDIEVACRIVPTTFQPKENAQLTYGQASDTGDIQQLIDLGVASGVLDKDGAATVPCPPAEQGVGFRGTGRVIADVSVFEAGSGRTTRAEARTTIHPEAWYLGLASGSTEAKANESFSVEGSVVDWNGALLKTGPREVQVEFLRLEEEWDWYWDEDEDEEVYRRHRREVSEGTTTSPVNDGKFAFKATPSADAAGFVVRVTAGAATTDLQLEMSGRRYWWSRTTDSVDQTPKPMTPKSIAIQHVGEITVGEETEITFEAPFAGLALLTVETDQLLTHKWIDVDPGPVSWRFTLSEFASNVYVSALVLKDPHEEDAAAFLPDRAFGAQSIAVKPTAFSHQVRLSVPEEVRSSSDLTVGVEVQGVEGPTFVTVAVVDEGILSLTNFESPNPFPDVFPKRKLDVTTYETLGWHIPRSSQPSSRTGGDEDGPSARVSPVKPVALWSGLVELDAQGRADIPFRVPEYRGKLRIMAVAAGPTRMGHAEASVTVRDPLVVQTTLPRFLIEGDVAQVPVFVTNVSGKARDIDVMLEIDNLLPGASERDTSAPVSLMGAPGANISLADGESGTLVFRLVTEAAVGAVRLHVKVESGDLVSKESLDVPLAPSAPRVRKLQQIELAGGQTVDLSQYLQGWLPTTEESTFWVTANPYAEALGHLQYLVRYPYGCIEQTTSSTRPLLVMGDLVPAVVPSLAGRAELDDMVTHGIERVMSMQTSSGGFGYWPGASRPSFWGTVYATHMLLDAQELGYEVSTFGLSEAISWLENEVQNNTTDASGSYYRHTLAYAHYVLAVAGRGRKAEALSLVESFKDAKDGAALEAAYLAKAALYLSGDRRFEKELARPDRSSITKDRRNTWSFYSDLRRRGLQLTVFETLFGETKDPTVASEMARLVARGLSGRQSRWYTTQEIVWGVTGLGKHVAGRASGFGPSKLNHGEKELPSERVAEGLPDQRWSLPRASEYTGLTLKTPALLEGSLYLLVESSGVRPDTPWTFGGEQIKVERTYLGSQGSELDTSALQLGDMVYSVITVTNTSDERIQNLALTERIPAGWEIENPRLGRGPSLEWMYSLDLWANEHMNIRDDRVEVFGALEAGESRSVVVGVRAVTAGTFTVPPVAIEAMYDPDIWARAPGSVITIDGAWDAFFL